MPYGSSEEVSARSNIDLCAARLIYAMLTESARRITLTYSSLSAKTVRIVTSDTLTHTQELIEIVSSGTVRQHDLRTTHQCRTGPARGSNCPVPLLEAPGGIELYTLSVSKLNPYLFTVAGTSAYAYLQDRRMTKQIAEEWSHRVDPGSQVQCVRRFGLPPSSDKGPGEAKRERWNSPRHITAVRMSPDVAEDVNLPVFQTSRTRN